MAKKGRPLGAKNTKTEEWEAFRDYCMTGGVQKMRKVMDGMEGKEFAQTFLQLLEYHKPKRARQEITGAEQNAIEIIVKHGNKH